MPNTLSLVSAALLAGTVSAQLAGLPSCAIKPAFVVIGHSECQLTEFKCICADADLLQSLTSTVQQACTNTADLSSARAAASSICEPYAAAAASSTATAAAAAYAAASATGTATAAASSGLATAASTAKATTAAPYAAGNATSANPTGASNSSSSSGNLVVAGSAAGPPKMQDVGLVAAFLAVMGGAALF